MITRRKRLIPEPGISVLSKKYSNDKLTVKKSNDKGKTKSQKPRPVNNVHKPRDSIVSLRSHRISASAKENSERRRTSLRKKLMASGSRSLYESNATSVKFSETTYDEASLFSSTPLKEIFKSKPKDIRQTEFSINHLERLLSPISSNIKPTENVLKETPITSDHNSSRRNLSSAFEDETLREPTWKRSGGPSLDYSRRQGFQSSCDDTPVNNSSNSNENENPYHLFSRPANIEAPKIKLPSKEKKIKLLSKEKKIKSKARKKNNDKAFENWCKSFNEEMANIETTELVIE